MNSNILLIQTLIDSGQVRKYAVFLKIKSLHSNGQIYNYTAYSLAPKIGMSISATAKYINNLKEIGWVKQIGNNIIFIGLDKMKALYGITLEKNLHLKLQSSDKVQDIVTLLRRQPLNNKQAQFNYILTSVENQKYPKGKGAIERYKKADKFLQAYKGEISTHLTVSQANLANLLNVSASTVSRLIKSEKITVIKGRRYYVKSPQILLPNNCFWNKGYVVKVECNSYIF